MIEEMEFEEMLSKKSTPYQLRGDCLQKENSGMLAICGTSAEGAVWINIIILYYRHS